MADLRQQLHGLELKGVEITSEEIGRGSYGKVLIVFYKGLKCAGKILHHELTQNANSDERVNLADRFANECIQTSNARHPNIVLFLGVYFQPQYEFPILVMEHLPMCLEECLAKYPNLPSYVKNNILIDVAKGLQYLHGMDLIHRDLTAKNVLIGDNLRAKIADLGVAKIISADIAGQFQKFTQVPGNAHYMPPEAFMRGPDDTEVKYDNRLDIFSYGNLIINTVTHKWPDPIGTAHNLKEVERRKADLNRMGESHPLRALTERCLSDQPDQRPSTSDIISDLEKVICDHPAPFRNTMELLQDYCRCSEENKSFQDQVKLLEDKKGRLERTASQLGDEHEANVKQISAQEKEICDMQDLVNTKDGEVKVKENLLHRRDEKIRALNMKIDALSRASTGQVSLFDPTVSLSCNKLQAELPQKRKHPQAVVHNDKVYVGSGYCETDELSYEVAAFSLTTNEWEQLPKSETRWFAMAVYENDLVLISGKRRNETSCTRVARFNEEDQMWMWPDDITEMPSARMGASATALTSHLLVAGGWDDTRNRVDTVEVYDKHKRQWFKAQPLPKLAAECKTAVADNDVWFFMGGANQYRAAFYASIRAIIKQAVPSIMELSSDEVSTQPASAVEGDGDPVNPSAESNQLWKILPDVPYEFCSTAIMGGSLVSIGGSGFLRNSRLIHAYNPHTNTWLKIGETPEECCRAVAVTLSSNSVLVLGGVDRNKSLLSTMYNCSLR